MADENPFLATLPENIRADATLKDFKDVGALAQSFIETKRLVGASIRPPGPDAAPEVRKDFIDKLQKAAPELIYAPQNADAAVLAGLWRRLGKPENVEGYEVDEAAATKVGLDPKELRALASKTGLTKGQFGELVKTMSEARVAEQTKWDAAHTALKAEWGAAYNERVQAAAAAAKKLGLSDAAVAAIVAGQAPAEQMKLLGSVAQALGTDPKELERQRDGAGGSKLTPNEAKVAMLEMMTNRAHAYWNSADPGHAAAVKRMVDLQGFANPDASKVMEVAGGVAAYRP